MKQAGWRLLVKKTFDRTIAAAGLVALGPLMAVTAAAVRINLGSPVVFKQTRPGFEGRPFVVYKFRTMRDARDAGGRPLSPSEQLLSDAARLTPFGKFLRGVSLDELPQLWNVLRGDLSLIGPRPLLMQYIGRYSAEQMRRHDVIPGITGWAQINGRNALSWDEKFALDVWYVDNWSLWLDAKILAGTFLQVVRREGISREGHATNPEFMGSAVSAPPLSPVSNSNGATSLG